MSVRVRARALPSVIALDIRARSLSITSSHYSIQRIKANTSDVWGWAKLETNRPKIRTSKQWWRAARSAYHSLKSIGGRGAQRERERERKGKAVTELLPEGPAKGDAG